MLHPTANEKLKKRNKFQKAQAQLLQNVCPKKF